MCAVTLARWFSTVALVGHYMTAYTRTYTYAHCDIRMHSVAASLHGSLSN